MNTDPEQKNYLKDMQPYLRRLQAIEETRRKEIETTKATLADVEDAVNYVIGELRRIADFLDFQDYKIK